MNGEQAEPLRLSRHKLVLYFYPKDDTSGCTREAQDFSALTEEFENAGTWILGVSKDNPKSHAKFAGKYGLGVKLASTGRQRLRGVRHLGRESLYGRKYMGIDRATFLIDRDGTVAKVWRKVPCPVMPRMCLRRRGNCREPGTGKTRSGSLIFTPWTEGCLRRPGSCRRNAIPAAAL